MYSAQDTSSETGKSSPLSAGVHKDADGFTVTVTPIHIEEDNIQFLSPKTSSPKGKGPAKRKTPKETISFEPVPGSSQSIITGKPSKAPEPLDLSSSSQIEEEDQEDDQEDSTYDEEELASSPRSQVSGNVEYVEIHQVEEPEEIKDPAIVRRFSKLEEGVKGLNEGLQHLIKNTERNTQLEKERMEREKKERSNEEAREKKKERKKQREKAREDARLRERAAEEAEMKAARRAEAKRAKAAKKECRPS